MINFIPNDPGATIPGSTRSISLQSRMPCKPRIENAADFSFPEWPIAPLEEKYPKESDEFLFWQCREGVFAALEVLERASGGNLVGWSKNKKTLLVKTNVEGFNDAMYRRETGDIFEPVEQPELRFGTYRNDFGTTTRTGASIDVCAHELGHAYLDATDPFIWNKNVEASAFHEAFSDCTALLTALAQTHNRKALLKNSGTLDSSNYVEAWAERHLTGNSMEPRHAFNQLQYVEPASNATLPEGLSFREHSFCRIFTGAFLKLICGLFSESSQTEDALAKSAHRAGELLLSAVHSRLLNYDSLFASVGSIMMQEAANIEKDIVFTSFEAHGIYVTDSTGHLSQGPEMPTSSSLLRDLIKSGSERVKNRRLLKEIGERFDLPFNDFRFTEIAERGVKIVRGFNRRIVPLDDIDSRLKDVVMVIPESVMLGADLHKDEVGGGARLDDPKIGDATFLGPANDIQKTLEGAELLVRTLLGNEQIRFSDDEQPEQSPASQKTHRIQEVDGNKQLIRFSYNCYHATSNAKC